MDDRTLREKGEDNQLEGTIDDVKGRLKDAAGGLTGDSKLQGEGKIDRAKGKFKDTVGKIQRDVADDRDDTI